jgi:predicted GNAT superfamily acetyltransferase
MIARLLDPHSAKWSAEIDRIGALLHAGQNPILFPYHFLQVVLPRLGGQIVWLEEGGRPVGVGFLFPRCTGPLPRTQPLRRAYTLRYHTLRARLTSARCEQIVQAVQPLMGGAEVVLYDPAAAHTYLPTAEWVGSISIGRPDADEAAHIPDLHRRIWGSPPEFLYPADIFSVEFAAGTGLVARVEGVLAGFLFGFYKFDGPALPADWSQRFRGELRLESQVMGVLPDYRGLRIANLLKRAQAEEAWRQGIGVVQWTADPLQFPNAALNFGLLRALAFDFYPDLYPFRNDLNRVPASRFGLTWLVGSARVAAVPTLGARALVLDLAAHAEIQRVNDGFADYDLTVDGPYIALEIPANWTELQQQSLEVAFQWRTTSDRLLAHFVGTAPGQYVITGAATEGDRRFLIGQRVDDALWEHLGHVGDY